MGTDLTYREYRNNLHYDTSQVCKWGDDIMGHDWWSVSSAEFEVRIRKIADMPFALVTVDIAIQGEDREVVLDVYSIDSDEDLALRVLALMDYLGERIWIKSVVFYGFDAVKYEEECSVLPGELVVDQETLIHKLTPWCGVALPCEYTELKVAPDGSVRFLSRDEDIDVTPF